MRFVVLALKWLLFYFLALIASSVVSLFFGWEWFPELLFHLPFGWISFVIRSYSRLSINVEATLVFTTAGALFFLGLHHLLRWSTEGSRMEPGEQNNGWRLRWTAGITALVWISFLAGTSLVGVSHQTAWLLRSQSNFEKEPGISMRPSARISVSKSRLKQMGTGAHNYVSGYRTFPPSALLDEHGQALHGWQTVLLPYLEEQELYRSIDLKRPWNDPVNISSFKREISQFLNPRVVYEDAEFPPIHYAANAKVLRSSSKLKPSDIPDGLSKTVLFGEAAGNDKPWGQPGNWRDVELGLNKSPDGFGGRFLRGTCFAMADGSVHRFDDDVDPAVLKALSTPAGGENFEMPADIPSPPPGD